MTTENFINKVLIEEIGDIVKCHPYLAALLIGCGIEFLGKCLDDSQESFDYKDEKACKALFEKAMTEAPTLQKYSWKDMYYQIRCGMVHEMRPEGCEI